MTFTPHGKHLIAGDWVDRTDLHLRACTAVACVFAGTPDLVDRAARPLKAFWSYGYSSREERAAFNTIADEIEARAEASPRSDRRIGLPEGRLQANAVAPQASFRMFASHILKGDYLDRAMMLRCQIVNPCRAPIYG